MSKSMEEEPEIEEVSPELEEIKKDPLNRVIGDITTQDDPQIKQSASTPDDLWQSWLDKHSQQHEDMAKLQEAQADEELAVEDGRIKKPTPKHLVDPKWKSWLESLKFQGMGDARYGNQHDTGNSDDYMSQQVKDEQVYIQSTSSKDKKDEKNVRQE